MRLTLGTIVFWIIIFGIKKIIETKTKIEKDFSLAITFSVIGIVMFFAGILNIMPLIETIIMLSGLGSFCYFMYKEKLPYENNGVIIFFDEDKELIQEAKMLGWKKKTELILEK